MNYIQRLSSYVVVDTVRHLCSTQQIDASSKNGQLMYWLSFNNAVTY